jgi:hypothetical protein
VISVTVSDPHGASAETRLQSLVGYGAGLIVGIVAVIYFFPLSAIEGVGGLWAQPGNVDLDQNLTGHLIFQRPGWHWPLLYSPDLFWPRGASIAMTDSNPLFSLIAKVLAGLLGHPVNLLGVWFALCWLMQPVAAVYVVRGLGARRWEAAAAAAVFASCFPAFLFRIGHINLCGHFMILFALGETLRMARCGAGARLHDWTAAAGILLVAIMMHPTLFLIDAAVMAAVPMQALIAKESRFRVALNFVAAILVAFVPFSLISGMTGGMDRGFGFYSMNMLSPLWPQQSGIFGSGLPIIDATGGQYEGFNYLGAGGLLVIAVAAWLAWKNRRQAGWARWRGVIVVMAGLTLLALSTEIYAGKLLILPLGTRQWDSIFGFVRSSGRLFWPVGYVLVLGSIVALSQRLPRAVAGVLLLIGAVLQIVDSGPLRNNARGYFAGSGAATIGIGLPENVTLLTTLPACTHTDDAQTTAALLRLDAARAGARLSDIKLSRLPRWFSCERALTDGTELPLLPGEVRFLLEPIAIERLRQGVLAPGLESPCRYYGTALVCGRDIHFKPDSVSVVGKALPVLAVPAALDGTGVAPILSFGWHQDADKPVFWSEGPRATLLARLTALPASGATLAMTVSGVAAKAGGNRPITVQIGRGKPVEIALADLADTEIDLPITQADLSGGVLRVAFDIDHPVDPKKRGLGLPVDRAGIKIESLVLSPAS